MNQNILYTLLIMSVLGFMLFSGLYGPPMGKKMVSSVETFLKWKPKVQEGPLNEAETTIKNFDESFKRIQSMRTMVLDTNKQHVAQLDETYKDVRENLQFLLLDMDKQTVTYSDQLFDKFQSLHSHRKEQVQKIIDDERTLVGLNDQMDLQLRNISTWLTEKALNPSDLTMDEMKRTQQFENLTKDLKAFADQSSHLDMLRIVLMRKSQEFVDQLDVSNQKIEENFSQLSSKISVATPDIAQGLWQNYEHLEVEQRDLIKNMNVNQDFIGENQGAIVNSVSVIVSSITYRPEDRLERFKENYSRLEKERTTILNNAEQRQNSYLTTKLATQDMKERRELDMQELRERARDAMSVYDQLEDYRRNQAITLDSMSDELRDDNQFIKQKIEDMRINLQGRIQQREPMRNFNLDRQRIEPRDNIRIKEVMLRDVSEGDSRINESIARNVELIRSMRSRVEDAQARLRDVMNRSRDMGLSSAPSFERLNKLQSNSDRLVTSLHNGEDQLRSAQQSQKESMESLKERIDEFTRSNQEKMRDMKDRADEQKRRTEDQTRDQNQRIQDQKIRSDDQKRLAEDRARDQMQRLRDLKNR